MRNPARIESRRPRQLAAAALGALVALAAWLALVRWDLSEIDASGRPIEGGADDQGPAIALVAVVLTVVAIAMAATRRLADQAAWFARGGLWTWTILFAWRAGSAETIGANMYLAPLVMVVIPIAVFVPLILRKAATRARALGSGVVEADSVGSHNARFRTP